MTHFVALLLSRHGGA
ncbi:leuA leader peptide [Actinoplanes sp. SE50/110]|nr:leuA leader peptide [Actinoplanes sp. SE50/110]